MKIKEGTFHVGIGPLKAQTRKWTTYQKGDLVKPEHVEQLKLKGAQFEGDVQAKKEEEKPFLNPEWIKELREINGVGKATAKELAQLYPDKNTLIDNLLHDEENMLERHKDNIVEALKEKYL